jgi:flagellar motility protein MotE (MotC chaperone)
VKNKKIIGGIFCVVSIGLFFTVRAIQAQEKKPEDKKTAAPAIAEKSEEKKETLAEAKAEGPKNSANEVPLAVTPAAIQEFQTRRDALDAREKDLQDRTNALEIQEKLLQEKLRRMDELNKKMAERLENYRDLHEGKIKKLVTLIETMRPAAAAPYLETVEPFLAVEVLTRIDVNRAAKIMNLVDKKKSAHLTELYAGYRDVGDDQKIAKKEGSDNTPK